MSSHTRDIRRHFFGIDPDSHILTYLDRTGEIIGLWIAENIADKKYAAIARLAESRKREILGHTKPLGQNEPTVGGGSGNSVSIPHPYRSERQINRQRRNPIVVDRMTAGKSVAATVSAAATNAVNRFNSVLRQKDCR